MDRHVLRRYPFALGLYFMLPFRGSYRPEDNEVLLNYNLCPSLQGLILPCRRDTTQSFVQVLGRRLLIVLFRLVGLIGNTPTIADVIVSHGLLTSVASSIAMPISSHFDHLQRLYKAKSSILLNESCTVATEERTANQPYTIQRTRPSAPPHRGWG